MPRWRRPVSYTHLAGVFKKLRGHGKLSEADIKAAMREVRMALLEADVNYKVAKDFCAKVSERAMGQEDVYKRQSTPRSCWSTSTS